MQRSAVRLSEWSVSFCFSSELVFDCAGFSLCSAGWQLFYAAIWVVGFLPAPGHVLDKVRQVSIETRPGGRSKKKKTERKSLQTEIVSLKLMSSSSLHAEPRWLAAAVLLWQLHVVPAVCAWLFCFFPFIPCSLQMHILHRMHRLSSVLCPSLVLDVMSLYISISVDFWCATKELQVIPVNVSPKCPSVNALKKQFPSQQSKQIDVAYVAFCLNHFFVNAAFQRNNPIPLLFAVVFSGFFLIDVMLPAWLPPTNTGPIERPLPTPVVWLYPHLIYGGPRVACLQRFIIKNSPGDIYKNWTLTRENQ